MNDIKDLQLGKAGEYLVCADLLLQGYIAYLTEQGLHYDLVVDWSGRLLRIQVKTTRTYRPVPQRIKHTPAYLFNVRRCGKGGRQRYKRDDLDIMALVALEEKIIGYIPIAQIKTTMVFRTRKYNYNNNRSGVYLEDFTFEKALDGIR